MSQPRHGSANHTRENGGREKEDGKRLKTVHQSNNPALFQASRGGRGVSFGASTSCTLLLLAAPRTDTCEGRTVINQRPTDFTATNNLPVRNSHCCALRLPVSRPASVQPLNTSSCGTTASGSSTSENVQRQTRETLVKSPIQPGPCPKQRGSRTDQARRLHVDIAHEAQKK